MKKSVKQIAKVALTIIACLSFIMLFAERTDGSICLSWTIGCVASLAISTRLLGKLGAFKGEGLK